VCGADGALISEHHASWKPSRTIVSGGVRNAA
jgi:hypothetical protein